MILHVFFLQSRCFEQKAQLLSINNNMEENILEGNMFKENLLQVGILFSPVKSFSLKNVTEVWTSGVSLMKGNWTWFGAGALLEMPFHRILIQTLTQEKVLIKPFLMCLKLPTLLTTLTHFA